MKRTPRIWQSSSLTRRAVDLVRGYGTPDIEYVVSEQEFRELRYRFLYELHNGLAYEQRPEWQEYNGRYGNYRHIRHIWSHAQRVTDFYAYRIYNGAIPSDGINLPDGVKSALPLVPTTDKALASAVAASLMTLNFQSTGPMLVTYVSMLGELLVELIDNPDEGEIQMEFVWPGTVKELVLDQSEDVVFYALEYDAVQVNPDTDEEERFRYRKEVDRVSFRTFKDDNPYAYPRSDGTRVPAVVENPYKTVPAVWFRHIKRIGVRGEPAIVGTVGSSDEINSLLSHLLDKTHTKLASPVLIAGPMPAGAYQSRNSMKDRLKRVITGEQSYPNEGREEIDVLTAETGTKMETLSIELSDARTIAEMLIDNIEANVPEVTVYQEMRKMTQITGPAAMQLFGDIEPKFRSIASGSYDHQMKKLLQKHIAMSGWRVNNDDWDGTRNVDEWGEDEGGLTELQQRFAPFNLGSFAEGVLYIDIMPRSLFTPTEREQVDTILQKKAVFDEFIPPEQYAKELGYKDEQIKEWTRLAEQRRAELDAAAAQEANSSEQNVTPEQRTDREQLGVARTKRTDSQQRGGMEGGRISKR